jgi:hypothetical protein
MVRLGKLLFFAHIHRSILGATGHNYYTDTSEPVVGYGSQIYSLSNPELESATFGSVADRANHSALPGPTTTQRRKKKKSKKNK